MTTIDNVGQPSPRLFTRVRELWLAGSDWIEAVRVAIMSAIERVAPLRRKAVFHGLLLGGYVGFLLLLARGTDPFAWDAYAYWAVDPANPYIGAYGTLGFFPYTPPIAVLAAPLATLPWGVFAVGWSVLLLTTLFWLGGRAAILMLAFPPIAADIYTGNINLLLGAAMVIGFRYPAAWTLVLLTKVTPGVGLVWFAVRREWRALGIALGVTVLIVAVSWLLTPNLWTAWLAMLGQNASATDLNVPLWLRLPVAALIVAWGATKNAPWTLPIAAVIAAPVIFFITFSTLAACWPLRHGLDRRA